MSGSFKSLNCVNNSGDIVGGISFGSDGKMWFNGDLYHRGYDYDKNVLSVSIPPMFGVVVISGQGNAIHWWYMAVMVTIT